MATALWTPPGSSSSSCSDSSSDVSSSSSTLSRSETDSTLSSLASSTSLAGSETHATHETHATGPSADVTLSKASSRSAPPQHQRPPLPKLAGAHACDDAPLFFTFPSSGPASPDPAFSYFPTLALALPPRNEETAQTAEKGQVPLPGVLPASSELPQPRSRSGSAGSFSSESTTTRRTSSRRLAAFQEAVQSHPSPSASSCSSSSSSSSSSTSSMHRRSLSGERVPPATLLARTATSNHIVFPSGGPGKLLSPLRELGRRTTSGSFVDAELEAEEDGPPTPTRRDTFGGRESDEGVARTGRAKVAIEASGSHTDGAGTSGEGGPRTASPTKRALQGRKSIYTSGPSTPTTPTTPASVAASTSSGGLQTFPRMSGDAQLDATPMGGAARTLRPRSRRTYSLPFVPHLNITAPPLPAAAAQATSALSSSTSSGGLRPPLGSRALTGRLLSTNSLLKASPSLTSLTLEEVVASESTGRLSEWAFSTTPSSSQSLSASTSSRASRHRATQHLEHYDISASISSSSSSSAAASQRSPPLPSLTTSPTISLSSPTFTSSPSSSAFSAFLSAAESTWTRTTSGASSSGLVSRRGSVSSVATAASRASSAGVNLQHSYHSLTSTSPPVRPTSPLRRSTISQQSFASTPMGGPSSSYASGSATLRLMPRPHSASFTPSSRPLPPLPLRALSPSLDNNANASFQHPTASAPPPQAYTGGGRPLPSRRPPARPRLRAPHSYSLQRGSSDDGSQQPPYHHRSESSRDASPSSGSGGGVNEWGRMPRDSATSLRPMRTTADHLPGPPPPILTAPPSARPGLWRSASSTAVSLAGGNQTGRGNGGGGISGLLSGLVRRSGSLKESVTAPQQQAMAWEKENWQRAKGGRKSYDNDDDDENGVDDNDDDDDEDSFISFHRM